MTNTEPAPVPEEHDPEDASTKPIGRVGERMQQEVDDAAGEAAGEAAADEPGEDAPSAS